MSTKKLLSISNLKKYFPLAKTSLFQKEQLYVKANENVSIDILEGETIGLVGESGCGKSTFGRVLLQLYSQTGGMSMYYGKKLADLAPKYVFKTLKNSKKYIEDYKKAQKKAEDISKQCEKLGKDATFFQLQDKNLAKSEAKTKLNQVANLLGGYMVLENVQEYANVLLEKYKLDIEIFNIKQKLKEKNGELEVLVENLNEENANKGKQKKVAKCKKIIEQLENKIATINAQRETIKQKIKQDKKQFENDGEFQKYEQMLDDGIDLSRLTINEMRLLRSDLQIIFQDPYSSLNPRMTVGQIIEEGLTTHKFYKPNSKKMHEHIVQIMEKCGLQEYMMHRYPHQFSGGQRQRISIARALAVNPKFVVCDECVSALDVSIQSQIINLLLDLKKEQNLTYLFISHDLSVVRYISDKICVMYLGNVVEYADAKTIFEDPRHPYTVVLLSSIPTTDVEGLSKERIILEGSMPSPIKPPSGCKFHTRCFMACEECKRNPPPLIEVEKGHFVACHKAEKKVDENGNYLFSLPKMEKKSVKIEEE